MDEELETGTESGKATVREPIDFDSNLAYHLAVVSNLLNTAVTRQVAERHGVGLTAWRLLAVLGAYAPMYAKDVCRVTGIDKATVSRTIHRMVGEGLVERRADPHDRRLTVLRLSAAGARLHDRITPLAKRFYAHVDAALLDDERRTLIRLLKKVRAFAATAPAHPDEEVA